jgi:hypothetical protein
MIESSFAASIGSRKENSAMPVVLVSSILAMFIWLFDGPIMLNETKTSGCAAALYVTSPHRLIRSKGWKTVAFAF